MKIHDSHVHIFNSKIVDNVINKKGLVKRLCLETENIGNRLSIAALVGEMRSANVHAALLLPTANVNNVSKMNRDCVNMVRETPELFTAGTLHPDSGDIVSELSYLNQQGVRVIKFCSFSQRFAL
ncbi:MAG: hypothetical protein JW882_08480, partial [Deltaproteobacteria bacterium]|nr:hypothetical protein [Deltaproteobacteria bacterium]